MTVPEATSSTGPTEPEAVALSDLAADLIAELPQHRSGRTARTVVGGGTLRAVVIALADGAEMAEHDAPPAATLYCISGQVTLRSGEQRVPLHAGQLVRIPPARHAVEAHADSAILLTVLHG